MLMFWSHLKWLKWNTNEQFQSKGQISAENACGPLLVKNKDWENLYLH